MTRIKICGLTRDEDVRLCEELRVDYLGFNFVKRSPRCIDTKQAKQLRRLMHRAQPVGIFLADQSDAIPGIAKEIGLSFAQIYGDVPNNFRIPGVTIIRAMRTMPPPHPGAAAPPLSRLKPGEGTGVRREDHLLLLDGPGNGLSADLESISRLPAKLRATIFLAGGLTAINVRAVIERIHPFAVDAASGVESAPGITDPLKLQAFVDAVRSSSPF